MQIKHKHAEIRKAKRRHRITSSNMSGYVWCSLLVQIMCKSISKFTKCSNNGHVLAGTDLLLPEQGRNTANQCRNINSWHPDGVSRRPSCVEQPKGQDACVFCLSDALANMLGPEMSWRIEHVLGDFTWVRTEDIRLYWKTSSTVWCVLICENHSTSQIVNPSHTSRAPKTHANIPNHFHQFSSIFPVICFGSWARKLAANVRVSALADLTAWRSWQRWRRQGAILDATVPMLWVSNWLRPQELASHHVPRQQS